MKQRYLISLISLLLLVAIFAGCVADDMPSTDPNSSDEISNESVSNGESEDESSDEVSRDLTPSTYYTAVSLGKSYTLSSAASDTYPDSYGTELTDGILASEASYTIPEFCGFNESVLIIIDLGENGQKLNRFTVEYLATTIAGISPLTSCSVFGSNDGEKYTIIGRLTLPEYQEDTVQTAVLEPEEKFDYRYIKFYCTKSSAWLFLSEITVYADVEPSDVDATFKKTEQAFKENGVLSETRAAELAAVASGAKLDRTLVKTLISSGMGYNIKNAVYDDRAKDTNKKMLTDASATGTTFDSEQWVGLDASKANEITLNLKSTTNDASGFALYAFSRPNIGIYLPVYVDVYAGQKKDDMHFVGRVYAANITDGNFVYEISLSCCINAAYVKFAFPANEDDGYYWFEEAAVYAYREPDPEADAMVYDTLILPEIKKDEYWSSSASDYNKNQNLILGLTQQIVSDQALLKSQYGGDKQNTPATSTWLTDGKNSSTLECYSGPWFHFYLGGGRTVIYDLGKVSAVTSYSANFLQYPSYAIQAPNLLNVLVSTDGKTWYVADANTYTSTDKNCAVKFEGEFKTAYKARFVAFSFKMPTGHCFADEFTVNGTKNAKNAVSPKDAGLDTFSISAPDASGYQAPSSDLLGGVHDVMLIYHNSPDYTYDKDFFMPYVAYLDEDGNIVDDFYDGYLFLPTVSNMFKGSPTAENYKSDWDSLFDSMFAAGYGLDALEAAAAETAQALGRDDFKVKFYPTLVYLSSKVTDFGDVDGDGVTESLATVEGKMKVVKWYVERVTKEFEARGYEHIELCGWYWFQEAIIGSDDRAVLPQISEYLHSTGTQFFWIPYYCASGYGEWKSLGFDVCCMQPNYAFKTSVSSERIEQATRVIELYGMCLEMEISGAALSDSRFFDKYMGYLGGGIEYGYINDCIRMYYQDVNVIAKAARSDNAKNRLIYDYTYQFVKGTLKAPETPEAQSVDATAGEVYVGRIGDGDIASIYRLEISAEHGSVTVCEDGTFYYYPDKGFTGTDTFSISLGNRIAWSAPCVVTVNVIG